MKPETKCARVSPDEERSTPTSVTVAIIAPDSSWIVSKRQMESMGRFV